MLRKFLPAIILVAVLCATASAASIYDPCASTTCSFNMSGIITVTANTITWKTDAPGNAPNLFTLTAPNGVFTVIPSGSQEGIANLANPPDVVGSNFGPFPFITFPVGGLPGLEINFIFPGIYTPAGCGGAPAVGQQCTLSGSPFSFVNVPGGPTGVQAQAGFVFSGVSADATPASPVKWTANFTSQFSVPLQTVLAAFGTGGSGSVTNSYSATTTVTVTFSQVPEPGTTALFMGGGLIGVSMLLRRRFANKRT